MFVQSYSNVTYSHRYSVTEHQNILLLVNLCVCICYRSTTVSVSDLWERCSSGRGSLWFAAVVGGVRPPPRSLKGVSEVPRASGLL